MAIPMIDSLLSGLLAADSISFHFWLRYNDAIDDCTLKRAQMPAPASILYVFLRSRRRPALRRRSGLYAMHAARCTPELPDAMYAAAI